MDKRVLDDLSVFNHINDIEDLKLLEENKNKYEFLFKFKELQLEDNLNRKRRKLIQLHQPGEISKENFNLFTKDDILMLLSRDIENKDKKGSSDLEYFVNYINSCSDLKRKLIENEQVLDNRTSDIIFNSNTSNMIIDMIVHYKAEELRKLYDNLPELEKINYLILDSFNFQICFIYLLYKLMIHKKQFELDKIQLDDFINNLSEYPRLTPIRDTLSVFIDIHKVYGLGETREIIKEILFK